ncbi:putative Phosducin-like protein [Mollisia scopiformis]|uniref:Putative Phosducin-like protein n=1 Tax=Mollisia scopiformis TaxID=149040 RepID=A0A194XPD2_MOLSC|nr:putative Phosducin-like protein [Mollisia scopiformis]KUJ22110.1 putative Phosducin-like protein [Mollisia scopiformis]
MASKTAAQEEFDAIIDKASRTTTSNTHHPSDLTDYKSDHLPLDPEDRDEETLFRESKLDQTMRIPLLDPRGGPMHLPHRSFDSGRTTGVKGVIADARSFEEARRNGSWSRERSREQQKSSSKRASTATFLKEDGEGSASEDEEFIERWRQQRRQELMSEGRDVRNRRTSPSVRRYGRFDEVDALGYLDAIEKVTRDTVVVVFVYDSECPVSQLISDALTPLVPMNPSIHFVRVHYTDIEFDNAGVPAILAYKNQGDLFANLTYIIDQIPDDTLFDTRALENVLRKNGIL